MTDFEHAAWFTDLVRQAVVVFLDAILPRDISRLNLDGINITWEDTSKTLGVHYKWVWGVYQGRFWQWSTLHTMNDALVSLAEPVEATCHPKAVSMLKDIPQLYEEMMRRCISNARSVG